MGSQKGPVVEWLCRGVPTHTYLYAVVLGGFKGRQGGAAGSVYSVGVLQLAFSTVHVSLMRPPQTIVLKFYVTT